MNSKIITNKFNLIVFLKIILCSSLLHLGSNCAPTPPTTEDQETITNVILTLTANDATKTVTTIEWQKPDGSKGTKPVTITPTSFPLKTNTTYTGTITIKNMLASTTAKQDITTDIQSKKNIHQFVYTFYETDSKVAATGISLTITDKDDNQKNVGLTYSIKTDASTNVKNLRIQLAHYQTGQTKQDPPPSTVDLDIDIVIPVTVGN